MTNVDAAVVVPPTARGGRILQTCENTQWTIRQIFEAAGLRLPERQVIVVGEVAYDSIAEDGDDGMFAIELKQMIPGRVGQPTNTQIVAGMQFMVEIVVHLIRRVPTQTDQGEVPEGDLIDAASATIMEDWAVLVAGIMAGRAHGVDGDPGSLQGAPYRAIMIADVIPYGPTGGVGGIVATLGCELV